ncbi:IclR family transcriptional regulator domain-containing protein [Methylobacterium oryzihabitans]|uniref:IclR family transcriptional regulator n=1 Tax=Methylobacterium oryzihabitans TaxID=2499852 RepID=A0A3S2W5N1_9HYPH|nr:IclR family transcriptional regulator C-terminal domain-containing protein [Methylobacterium oryzihabitans]RVU14255.1 IclR family transcriptional regulator [Methylobacterium oryzihabitans]
MPRLRRPEDEPGLADRPGPEYLEILARGLRVVAAFNAGPRQMTLSELAALVDAPRSTVRRVLLTLEHLGYVARDGRHFSLTPRVLVLASAYLTSNPLPALMQPVVDGLSRRTGEACSAAVLDRDEAVMIARASPSRIITVGLEVGYRLPAYCSAVGRVLLGGLTEPDLDAALGRTPLERLTPATVTDPVILKALVIAGREQGYSLVDEEAEHGFRSIAVPVTRRDGSLACALHIGLAAQRASVGRMLDEFLPLLRAAAAEIGPLVP